MIRLTPKGVRAAKDFYAAVTRVSRGRRGWRAKPGAPHEEHHLVTGGGCRSTAGA